MNTTKNRDAASGPCRPEATPAAQKTAFKLLCFTVPLRSWSQQRDSEKKRISFSLHHTTLMPLDRKKQETCLLVEKGRKKQRKWKGSRSHPHYLTHPAPTQGGYH
jgi:hypothetical protein